MLSAGEFLPNYDPGVKASALSTGGSLTLIESTIEGGPPRHVHSHEDEGFYLLDGSLTVYCGDDVFEAGARSFVFLPRGVPHHFRTSSGPTTMLLIVTPGGIEEYFREVRRTSDPVEQDQIGEKYGIHRV